MQPAKFPVAGQRFLNREAFTLEVQGYCWERGLDFHDVLLLSSNTGNGVKYACQDCYESVVGVKREAGHGRRNCKDSPCVVDLSNLCECILTKQPIDTLEKLRQIPEVGLKFNRRMKIRALVEIWCHLNRKPKYHITKDFGQCFFWKCPVPDCGGLITVKKISGFFIIQGSVPCACQLPSAKGAISNAATAGIAVNGNAVSFVNTAITASNDANGTRVRNGNAVDEANAAEGNDACKPAGRVLGHNERSVSDPRFSSEESQVLNGNDNPTAFVNEEGEPVSERELLAILHSNEMCQINDGKPNVPGEPSLKRPRSAGERSESEDD